MNVNTILQLIPLLAILETSFQISLPTDQSYYAGVVEFAPTHVGTEEERTRNNANQLKDIIETLEADLDIIVLPEYVLAGIKTYVPDPALKIAPCDIPDFEYFLAELSCAARSRHLYVVVNVAEKVICAANDTERCDANGLRTYNTNVVLDRKGRVISRYRKTHLWRQEWYSTSVLAHPDIATFTTDFGVTFGHFICFDMLYYEPAKVLIDKFNITDIIYPTYWFSELPFLTALQIQEGWAFGNDVNLLAANANHPTGKNSGSGIYAGRFGRLNAAVYENTTTKLLTAHVPKREYYTAYAAQLQPIVEPIFVPQLETERFTKLALFRDYNVDVFITKLLAANFTEAADSLCHNTFCCTFNVRRTLINATTTHAAYQYRFAVYSGTQTTFQRSDRSDLSICAVIACTNSELYSCGHIFPANVRVGNAYYFNAVNVSGLFRDADRRLIMPNTVDAVMEPLPVHMFDWNEHAHPNETHVTIALNAPKANLLTFGILANYYSLELSRHNLEPLRLKTDRNDAAAVKLNSMSLLLAVFLAYFIY